MFSYEAGITQQRTKTYPRTLVEGLELGGESRYVRNLSNPVRRRHELDSATGLSKFWGS